MTDVVVYGASGFTGTLACQTLERLDVPFAMAGRDRGRLEAAAAALTAPHDIRVAAVHDEDALRTAMAEAKLIINCAGPFSVLGEPIIAAAIDAGADYLDTTGEQAFMRDIYERYESLARRRGVSVVNACAFEVAVGDWAASLAASHFDGGTVDEVSVCYAIGNFRPSTGTGLSILSSLEAGGFVWAHDRWEESAVGSEVRPVVFPRPFGIREAISFPSGEVVTIPRHIDSRRVQTYFAASHDSSVGRIVARSASLFGPALGTLMKSPVGAFAKARLGAWQHTPSDIDRSRSRFAVLARCEQSFKRKQVTVVGSDPYSLTASILGLVTVDRLSDRPWPAGVITPAQAVDPGNALAQLSDSSLIRVEVEG